MQTSNESSFQVYFPINIKNTHWYLMVINGPKGVIQILESKGTAPCRPQVQQLVRDL
jgi:Ulp1 family protease